MASILKMAAIGIVLGLLAGCSSYSTKTASNDDQYANRVPCNQNFAKMTRRWK